VDNEGSAWRENEDDMGFLKVVDPRGVNSNRKGQAEDRAGMSKTDQNTAEQEQKQW
jgi:hypothetical protein